MSVENFLLPDLAPNPGVFISSNGKIIIRDSSLTSPVEYDVIKVARAIIRMNNNISTYFEASLQTGTTYAGLVDCNGSITRAYMNMAETRLVMGSQNEVDQSVSDLLEDVEAHSGAREAGVLDFNRYSPQDIQVRLVVGEQLVNGVVVSLAKAMEVTASNVLFSNSQISFDSRDLIRSGPLDYLASHAFISVIDPIDELTP